MSELELSARLHAQGRVLVYLLAVESIQTGQPLTTLHEMLVNALAESFEPPVPGGPLVRQYEALATQELDRLFAAAHALRRQVGAPPGDPPA